LTFARILDYSRLQEQLLLHELFNPENKDFTKENLKKWINEEGFKGIKVEFEDVISIEVVIPSSYVMPFPTGFTVNFEILMVAKSARLPGCFQLTYFDKSLCPMGHISFDDDLEVQTDDVYDDLYSQKEIFDKIFPAIKKEEYLVSIR
jgi:hypothetical protein